MTDIFNNTILCGRCGIKMNPLQIIKNGFALRAIECSRCKSRIIHPKDEKEYNDFVSLKKKQYHVKMRFVGNSYAVSIPKEIVNFMREQEKMVDNMVKLCFEDFGRISLKFSNSNDLENDNSKLNNSQIKTNRGD